MRSIITFLFLGCFSISYGQLFSSFDDIELSENSFLNGSDADGSFRSGNFDFNNDYNPEYDSWSGWAISNTTDTETVDYGNQYSAITGSGYQSDNYAVSYSESMIYLENGIALASGVYITNSTLTYNTILDGNQFSKKFGGATGDDPDYFLVNFISVEEGEMIDTVQFYLADYRFEDNNDDYVLDEWTWVDLSGLGDFSAIIINYESSDVGQFGINTPTYACFDDFTVESITVGTEEIDNRRISIYPNPSSDYINVEGVLSEVSYEIYSQNGRVVKRGNVKNGKIDIGSLESGNYIFTLVDDGVRSSAKIVKL